MSGGHYDYGYSRIESLLESIEEDYKSGKIIRDDISKQQEFRLIQEINDLIAAMSNISQRAKALEWYMSGDYGIESYIKKLNEIER